MKTFELHRGKVKPGEEATVVGEFKVCGAAVLNSIYHENNLGVAKESQQLQIDLQLISSSVSVSALLYDSNVHNPLLSIKLSPILPLCSAVLFSCW